MESIFNELFQKWKGPVPSTTLVLFIAAVVPGVIIVWVATEGHVYKILYFLKLSPFHPTPTAWEWCFPIEWGGFFSRVYTDQGKGAVKCQKHPNLQKKGTGQLAGT